MTNSRKLLILLAFGLVSLSVVFFAPDVQLGGKVDPTSIEQVKVLQEEYFTKHGEYLQVVDGALPVSKVSTDIVELGVDVPQKFTVEPYVTPDGQKGYSVREKTETTVRSINYGPQSEDWRSYIHDISTPTSTIKRNFDLFGDLFGFAYPLAHAVLTSNTHSTDLERGSSQYWSITDASQTGLDAGASFTVMARIYLESLGSPFDTHTIAAKGSATGGTRQFRYSIRNESGAGRMVLQASSAGSSFNGDTVVDSTAWSATTWYLVGFTFDGGALAVKYYRDGSQFGTTQTTAIASIFNSTSPFSIGAENVGVTPAEFFDGFIDDVRVWNRVLSAAEISSLYSDPCNFDNGANLSAHWLFDNTALDETANNNDLTGSGSPTYSTTHAFDCVSAAPPDWTEQGDTYYYP